MAILIDFAKCLLLLTLTGQVNDWSAVYNSKKQEMKFMLNGRAMVT